MYILYLQFLLVSWFVICCLLCLCLLYIGVASRAHPICMSSLPMYDAVLIMCMYLIFMCLFYDLSLQTVATLKIVQSSIISIEYTIRLSSFYSAWCLFKNLLNVNALRYSCKSFKCESTQTVKIDVLKKIRN